MSEPIDIVYCWCDGTDPNWRAARTACALRYGVQLKGEAYDERRTQTNDDLRYSLRSLERNAPWLRTVLLVLNDEATPPPWLRTDHPRLRIVRLGEFLPPEFLPCFNSVVIERFLYRIPGLSERFLYANDDMHFNRPAAPSFFFAGDGYPICRFTYTPIPLDGSGEMTMYRRLVLNADDLVSRKFGLRGEYAKAYHHWPQHNIDAYLKSDYAACAELFHEELDATTCFPFRRESDVERTLFMRYALCVGHGHFRYARRGASLNRPWFKRLLRPGFADSLEFNRGKWRQALPMLRKFKPTLFCINDTDGGYSPENSRKLQDLYRGLFPEPSSFERKDS